MPEKCTDLGDITEDGQSKTLSSKEIDQTASLLDKLGVVSEDQKPDGNPLPPLDLVAAPLNPTEK